MKYRKRHGKRGRTACEGCRARKIRCDGGFPCEQCVKLDFTCEHDDLPVKRSATRALDRRALVYGASCAAASSWRLQLLVPTLPRELSFNGVSFGSRELQFINLYLKAFHTSFPVIPIRMFREGVNPVSFDEILSAAADERPKIEASRAVSWAAAAVGASSSDVSLAHTYAAAAVRHLRQCFEVPCEESVMAYVLVGTAAYHLGDLDTFFRYADFADAMEDTMPPMVSEHKHALTLLRMRVYSVSNGARCRDKAMVLPSLEEIEQMELPLKLLFLEKIHTQKVHDVMLDPTISKEEKVRACREAIDAVTPLLEVLETNEQYRDCNLARVHVYLPLCYFWAVCGDKAHALHCASRFLDVCEENVAYMAVPNASHIGLMSSFLAKLGAFDLQQRLEKLCEEGAKYVIWTPPRADDVVMLPQLEALAEELQQGGSSGESTAEIEPSQLSFPQQLAELDFDFDFGEEFGLWDDIPDSFDVLGEFRRFTESAEWPSA